MAPVIFPRTKRAKVEGKSNADSDAGLSPPYFRETGKLIEPEMHGRRVSDAIQTAGGSYRSVGPNFVS